MDRGLLFLKDSKTGARAIILNQLAQNILQRQARCRKYVFSSEFRQLDENGDIIDKPLADLKKPWQAVRRHAGLEDVRIHDLRHSFASVGASAGMGLTIVGALIGHKHASTTQRYAHLDANPLRQASDEIAARIAASMKMVRTKFCLWKRIETRDLRVMSRYFGIFRRWMKMVARSLHH